LVDAISKFTNRSITVNVTSVCRACRDRPPMRVNSLETDFHSHRKISIRHATQTSKQSAESTQLLANRHLTYPGHTFQIPVFPAFHPECSNQNKALVKSSPIFPSSPFCPLYLCYKYLPHGIVLTYLHVFVYRAIPKGKDKAYFAFLQP